MKRKLNYQNVVAHKDYVLKLHRRRHSQEYIVKELAKTKLSMVGLPVIRDAVNYWVTGGL